MWICRDWTYTASEEDALSSPPSPYLAIDVKLLLCPLLTVLYSSSEFNLTWTKSRAYWLELVRCKMCLNYETQQHNCSLYKSTCVKDSMERSWQYGEPRAQPYTPNAHNFVPGCWQQGPPYFSVLRHQEKSTKGTTLDQQLFHCKKYHLYFSFTQWSNTTLS